MEIMLTIGKVILLLLAITTVALPFITERRNYKFVWSVWRRFQIKMFFECLGIIMVTLAVAIALWQVPELKYGLINLFFSGRSSNILIKPIQDGSESASVLVRLTAPLFFVALAFALPFLARSEEMIFRKGHDEWGSIVKQSIKFGFIHCLVGVPLAGGFAIIIPGLFFGLKYKRALERNSGTMSCCQAEDEAVMESTAYHTMYNMIMVGFFLFLALAAV